MKLAFSPADLALFSEASLDRTPLHTDASYAAATAYGGVIVFGGLGALACLSALPVPPGSRIASLDVEFRHALFAGVEYRVMAGDGSARLMDGGFPAVRLQASFQPVEQVFSPAVSSAAPWQPRSEPAVWAGIPPGTIVEGPYRPGFAALHRLLERWNLAGEFARLNAGLLWALLWNSYYTGMELPGRQGLSFRSRFQLDSPLPAGEPLLAFRAEVRSVDPRLSLVESHAELRSSHGRVATVTVQSFNRRPAPEFSPDLLASVLPASSALSGKTALVTGAGSGLGFALAAALQSQGCRLAQPAEAPDILVLNASPPVQPLRLEPEFSARLESYLARALSLIVEPLTAWAGAVENRGGVVVLISCADALQPHRDRPHHAAAKRAAEALVKTAALQYPRAAFLTVRPGRLQTELLNTPFGLAGAARVETVAAAVLRRLLEPLSPGQVQLLTP